MDISSVGGKEPGQATGGAARPPRARLSVVVVGHVDHGKSTLIGRLLDETGAVPAQKRAALAAMARRRGMPFEWSFLLDAFQEERDQAVTIDTTRAWLRTGDRDVVLIDAPGHGEFTRNMVCAAAAADAALLVVDAAEGVGLQTRRHCLLLHLLGVRQLAVAATKMDLVGWNETAFRTIEKETTACLSALSLVPSAVIPVAARDGSGVTRHDPRLSWYKGPTVLETLRAFRPSPPLDARPLRLPVQDVYKFDHRRIVVGRIESGTLRVGDRLMFSPVNRSARVRSIEAWNAPVPPTEARAGESVGITLDEPIFVERGTLASHMHDMPRETPVFAARIFWLDDRPLERGRELRLKLATAEAPVTVQAIESVVDAATLEAASAAQVERHGIAQVVLRSRRMLALDSYADNPATGRFVLFDGYDIVGGGTVSAEAFPDQRPLILSRPSNVTPVAHKVSRADRQTAAGHKSGVLWFTGLSAAGKTTLALALEQRLFERGYLVYVLDGDNVRSGLNADLGFSPADRAENIRRIGEVAALFADAGFIVITAFISPYRAERERARRAVGDGFYEVYVSADLATCERRDPKGLYRRARAGDIENFTGISAPYEPPETPDLVIDTATADVEACLDRLTAFVEERFANGR